MVIILNRKRWYASLRWKLFIIYFFISLIPLLFFSNIMSQSIEDYFAKDRGDKLLNQAQFMAVNISKANYLFDESKRPMFENYLQSRTDDGVLRIIVVDGKGIVVNDTHNIEIGKTYLVSEVMSALEKNDAVRLYAEQDIIRASAFIVNEASAVVGAVLLVESFKDISNLLSVLGRTLMLLTVFTGLVVAVLVFFISQLIIDPLKSILKGVQKMSEGYLDERIEITSHDEFAELGTAFNNMSEKLERVETTRQEFVANVSHELKTPLSSIKVLSDSILLQENPPKEMYKEFLQDISNEIDRMTFILDDLLTLVKLDQRESALNLKGTDVNKMVEDLLKRLYPLAEQKSIELLYEDVRQVNINADEMKLSLAISNLVENAIKYTYENGIVKVIVDCDHQNAFITIQDTGIGISEDEQDKVFTRFYRVDKTRDRETGGTGLGLAITHSTILLHRGSIRLASKLNVGSTFIVRLPMH